MKNNSYYTEEEKKQRFNFIPFVSPLTHRVYIIYKDGTTCSSPANFQTDEEAISTAKDYINDLTLDIPVEKVIVLKYDETGACDNAIYEGIPEAKPQEIKTMSQSKNPNSNITHKTMKTQIFTLIHGNPSTPGTNSHDRAAIAAKVIEENPKEMTVAICGHTITLYANYSTSGKSVTYVGPVTNEAIISEIAHNNNWQFVQQTIKAMGQGLAKATLLIYGDMTAEIQIHHRHNDRCNWKLSKSLRVEERTITIL